MSAGIRGAVVTTVLTMWLVPIFTHHDVKYEVQSSSETTSVEPCPHPTLWEPWVGRTVVGTPPNPPAPFTQVVTTVVGKCLTQH